MTRDFYLALASRGLRMPIGTDLVLHEEADPEQARRNGAALGKVVERSARRWGTELALPLMDLRLEKIDLLGIIGVGEDDADKFHFPAPLDEATMAQLTSDTVVARCAASQARDEALAYIADKTELVPVGMAIGPFSLLTRLMKDPITAAGLAGAGVGPEESAEVRLLEQVLRIAKAATLRSVRSQIAHGAKAIMVCEPAASVSYISPRQMRSGALLFENIVMSPNLAIKKVLDDAGVDLIFHDCGELIPEMVESFAHRLHPVILSLGSSRKLWEDAALVPKDVVLYGNLPSRTFYSDEAMPTDEVVRRTAELVANMKECGHPYIAGSECDVLYVPGAADRIVRKVEAILSAEYATHSL